MKKISLSFSFSHVRRNDGLGTLPIFKRSFQVFMKSVVCLNFTNSTCALYSHCANKLLAKLLATLWFRGWFSIGSTYIRYLPKYRCVTLFDTLCDARLIMFATYLILKTICSILNNLSLLFFPILLNDVFIW